jgi:hypothetical protein
MEAATGFGDAAAAVATVGGLLGVVTVTLAVPLCGPAVAVTVYGPPAVTPAVKRPDALMVPPPLSVQVNEGGGDMAAPNWSFAVAVNCCVVLTFTVALAGATVTIVWVWFTVTATELVTV